MPLINRIRRLSAKIPKRLPPIPGVDPQWQELARSDPEARTRAVLLGQRAHQLWPDRSIAECDFIDDDICLDHYLWLEANRLGGLEKWFAQFLEPQSEATAPCP